MITIISTCKFKILEEEYVKPLVRIAEKIDEVRVIHYKKLHGEPDGDIIISGTAIKDFEYLNHLDKFEWLKETENKVIGICAGAQIISLTFGAKLKEKEIIGVEEVEYGNKRFKAYFLITKIPILNENFEVLGKTGNIPAIFRVKSRGIYGFLFHPEVLNEELLLEFLCSGRL